jgi:hypothetical protein
MKRSRERVRERPVTAGSTGISQMAEGMGFEEKGLVHDVALREAASSEGFPTIREKCREIDEILDSGRKSSP